MRAQRPGTAAPVVDATAERLPFDDDTFDAAMAMVTIHQWNDVVQGLREMRLVSRGPVVVLTIDPAALHQFWLADCFPEVSALDQARLPTSDPAAVQRGLARLEDDLATGCGTGPHGHVCAQVEFDGALRLITAHP
jgi:SAM-dependent methyltransferase